MFSSGVVLSGLFCFLLKKDWIVSLSAGMHHVCNNSNNIIMIIIMMIMIMIMIVCFLLKKTG